ncbi:MAG: hypothetical protein PHC61_13390 [Chitinivibrionales bacterium]|nr:hypothetical protein [Chitinivibrionales bacterium]
MKPRLFLIVLLPMLSGCLLESPQELRAIAKDTLYTTVTTMDSRTYYSWVDNGTQVITQEKPFMGDTIPVQLSKRFPCIGCTELPIYFNAPITRFVNNGAAQETVFVYDTFYTRNYDTIHLPVSPTKAFAFTKTHGPFFVDKDSVRHMLDTLREGYWDAIELPIMHYPNDSTIVTLHNNPDFISFDTNAHTECSSYDFYSGARQLCVSCIYKRAAFISADHNRLIARPDSTAGDSLYTLSITATNRSGMADSVTIQTRVKPYREWRDVKDLVKISFVNGFTKVDSAAADTGIAIQYQITVLANFDSIIAVPQVTCAQPDSTGLIFLEELYGNGQRYCLCDHGECLSQPTGGYASRLKKGIYLRKFSWHGRNWNGPSDTNNPEGAPFPAGKYTLKISAQGKKIFKGVAENFAIIDSISVVLTN